MIVYCFNDYTFEESKLIRIQKRMQLQFYQFNFHLRASNSNITCEAKRDVIAVGIVCLYDVHNGVWRSVFADHDVFDWLHEGGVFVVDIRHGNSYTCCPLVGGNTVVRCNNCEVVRMAASSVVVETPAKQSDRRLHASRCQINLITGRKCLFDVIIGITYELAIECALRFRRSAVRTIDVIPMFSVNSP